MDCKVISADDQLIHVPLMEKPRIDDEKHPLGLWEQMLEREDAALAAALVEHELEESLKMLKVPIRKNDQLEREDAALAAALAEHELEESLKMLKVQIRKNDQLDPYSTLVGRAIDQKSDSNHAPRLTAPKAPLQLKDIEQSSFQIRNWIKRLYDRRDQLKLQPDSASRLDAVEHWLSSLFNMEHATWIRQRASIEAELSVILNDADEKEIQSWKRRLIAKQAQLMALEDPGRPLTVINRWLNRLNHIKYEEWIRKHALLTDALSHIC